MSGAAGLASSERFLRKVIKIGFTGVAEGRYSVDPPALLGTWNISDDSTLLAGQGTWTTTLAEPLE